MSERLVRKVILENTDGLGHGEEGTPIMLTLHRLPLVFLPVPGLRVMLIANIAPHDHMVNGQTGQVVGFSERPVRRRDKPWYEIQGCAPPVHGTLQARRGFPEVIWVRFDDDSVGYLRKQTLPAHLGPGEAVPITPFRTVLQGESGVSVLVTQFPLVPANALTIHKAQGMTLKEAAIQTRDCFQPGLLYVALSRVSSLAGLSLLDHIRPEDIQPRPKIDEEMDRLRAIGLSRITPVRPGRPARQPEPPAAPCLPPAMASKVRFQLPKPQRRSLGASAAQLNAELEPHRLKVDITTRSDGNCLFDAIARSARNIRPELRVGHAQLRHEIFDYCTPQELELAALENNMTPEAYRQHLTQSGVWGGSFETILAARALGVPIVVAQVGSARTYTPTEEHNGWQEGAAVIAYNGLSHYYGTLPL